MVSPDLDSEKQPSTETSVHGSPNFDPTPGDKDDVAPIGSIDTKPLNAEDYPTGIRLAAIVISLMLGTFLVALDNVSSPDLPVSTS